MDVDKFIEETEFYADLDIWEDYKYSDIVNIISNYPECKEFTSEDIKNILSWLEDYIRDNRQETIQEELDTISTEIDRVIYSYREHCSYTDILKILVKIANDYAYE